MKQANSNLPLSSQNTENDDDFETSGGKRYNLPHTFPLQEI
jgi:hypothetical protein